MGFLGPVLVFFGRLPKLLFAGKWEHADKNFWKDSKFKQPSVDIARYTDGVIKAQVDGQWKEYQIRTASEPFRKWNCEKRIEFIDNIKKGQMPGWGGPHSGAVATYGLGRLDSEFTLNSF